MHNKKFFRGPTLTEPTSNAWMHLSQEGAGLLSALGGIMVIIILCSEHNKRGCSFMASESLALLVEPVKATRKIFLLGCFLMWGFSAWIDSRIMPKNSTFCRRRNTEGTIFWHNAILLCSCEGVLLDITGVYYTLPRFTRGRRKRFAGVTIEHVIVKRPEEQPPMLKAVFIGYFTAISSCYIPTYSITHRQPQKFPFNII